MNRQTITKYFRVGSGWAFRIISKWDDSELARGQARRKREAEQQAKKEHERLRHESHHHSN